MALPKGTYSWAIYKIENPNGRVYVGVTSNFKNRMRNYRVGKQSQPLISRSISKYGLESHSITVLEEFQSDTVIALSKEMFWVRSYMSNRCKWPEINGMNLTDGGDGTIGFKLTDEKRKAMSQAFKGFKHTEETKKKIGAASRGNKYRLGYKMSKEQIEHRSSKIRGRKIAGEQLEAQRRRIVKIFGKPIVAYTTDGVFVKEFAMIKDAKEELRVKGAGVNRVLSGQFKQTNGFIFKYKQQCH